MMMLDSCPAIKSSNYIKIEYKTGSGKVYPLEIGYGQIPSMRVPVDVSATRQACQNGCKLYGRNGGCPPFSPTFHEICKKNLLIIYAKLLTKYYPRKILAGPFYTRWAFVETFITTLTNKIGKDLAISLGGYFISSGNCRSCRPKRCAVKEGNHCRNINIRTYSLESTGVLVVELMKHMFNLDLQWWKKHDHNYIPEFMVKVIGITSELPYNTYELRNELLRGLTYDRISFYE